MTMAPNGAKEDEAGPLRRLRDQVLFPKAHAAPRGFLLVRKYDLTKLIRDYDGTRTLRAENERLRAVLTQTREALSDAKDHLDYCGWGDSWERECAKEQGLQPKIDAALDVAEEALK
jgi:methylmalonyl-CoA mutase N-terminal domain/subunit